MEGLGATGKQSGLVLRARIGIAVILVTLSTPTPSANADLSFTVGCNSTDTVVNGMPETTDVFCTGDGIARPKTMPAKGGRRAAESLSLLTPSPCSIDSRSGNASRTFSDPTNERLHGTGSRQEDCHPGQVPTVTPTSLGLAASAQVAAKTLADQARSEMNLPLPKMVMTPAADAMQYVSLPIWLQLSPTSWVSKSATASAGGATLTVHAEPTTAVWSMGDGSTVTCHGPGTPYPAVKPKDPMAHSPDCGYTYTAPSASRPRGTYPVSVTVHWKVDWSTTTGLSGSEPDLTAVASTRLRVAEIQALVTEVGS